MSDKQLDFPLCRYNLQTQDSWTAVSALSWLNTMKQLPTLHTLLPAHPVLMEQSKPLPSPYRRECQHCWTIRPKTYSGGLRPQWQWQVPFKLNKNNNEIKWTFRMLNKKKKVCIYCMLYIYIYISILWKYLELYIVCILHIYINSKFFTKIKIFYFSKYIYIFLIIIRKCINNWAP